MIGSLTGPSEAAKVAACSQGRDLDLQPLLEWHYDGRAPSLALWYDQHTLFSHPERQQAAVNGVETNSSIYARLWATARPELLPCFLDAAASAHLSIHAPRRQAAAGKPRAQRGQPHCQAGCARAPSGVRAVCAGPQNPPARAGPRRQQLAQAREALALACCREDYWNLGI